MNLTVVLVLLSLAAATGGSAEDVRAPIEPQEIRRIAFVKTNPSKHPGFWDIYVANQGTGETRRLTDDQVMDRGVTWSPDGTKLAFSRSTGQGIAPRQPNEDIFVMTLNARSLRQLTQDMRIDMDPVWSPDGTKIAFTRYFGSYPARAEIFVMDADGTNEVRLTYTRPYQSNEPAWSPYGTHIAFTSDSGRGLTGDDLYVMHADGTGARLLVAGNLDEEDPEWSPDGTRIAFTRTNGSVFSGSIFVADAITGEVVRLTERGSLATNPSWSPDGMTIAFSGNRRRDHPDGIYVMEPAPGAEWTFVSRYAGEPSWAR
ncbi:MAG: hypothetical protein M3271_04545 [Actinomycetota bacterium]|nr:hypothetical protein [Actinomycetota bacterium]